MKCKFFQKSKFTQSYTILSATALFTLQKQTLNMQKQSAILNQMKRKPHVRNMQTT